VGAALNALKNDFMQTISDEAIVLAGVVITHVIIEVDVDGIFVSEACCERALKEFREVGIFGVALTGELARP
jgi:hypothetical protein